MATASLTDDKFVHSVLAHYDIDKYFEFIQTCDNTELAKNNEDFFKFLSKRLEGGVFQWPRITKKVREITPQQYRWLIEGLAIDQKKVIQKLGNQKVI